MSKESLIKLLALMVNIRIAHWRASTINNTHAALGAAYDYADDLIDSVVEHHIGRTGDTTFPAAQIAILPTAEPADLARFGKETVEAMIAECKESDLQTILADLLGAFTMLSYKLGVQTDATGNVQQQQQPA